MIKTVSRRAALLASLFLPLCGTLAAAPAQAEPLSLAVSAPPASIDPHYYTLTPSIMLSSHIFSRLVQRDENSRLAPDLGFMAASRPLRGSIVNGDAGFGQTEVLAMTRLLEQQGLTVTWPSDLDDLLS